MHKQLIQLISRTILYAGFKPLVSFKISFLKSSTNPTTPNPNIASVSGKISLLELYKSIAPIISVIIITIPPIVGVPCFIK